MEISVTTQLKKDTYSATIDVLSTSFNLPLMERSPQGMNQEDKGFGWFMYEKENNYLIWERSNKFGEMHSHSIELKFFS